MVSRKLKCPRSSRVQSILKDLTVSRIVQISSVSAFCSPCDFEKRLAVSVLKSPKSKFPVDRTWNPQAIRWLFLWAHTTCHDPITFLSAISTHSHVNVTLLSFSPDHKSNTEGPDVACHSHKKLESGSFFSFVEHFLT